MTTPADLLRRAAELLRLPDDQYFSFDDTKALGLQERLGGVASDAPPAPGSKDPSPTVLVAGGPSVVDLGRGPSIPVLLGTYESGRRRWSVDHEQNTRLVVMDLATGVVRSRRPFTDTGRDEPAEPSGSGTPPDAVNAGATTSSVRRVDVGLLVEHDWRPTRIAVTFIQFDVVSNTVVIELKGGTKEPARAAAQLPTAAVARSAAARPASPGATLTVPEHVAAGAPIPMQAAMTLPAAVAALVPATDPPEAKLLRASLLLVKLDAQAMVQADLALPANVTGGQVDAAFEADARVILARQPLAGTHQVYLAVGDRIVGPRRIVVDP